MASILDVTKLSLRDAFDFAIMIEEDAQLRYEQLSRLVGDDPAGVGAVFQAMALNEVKHRSDLVARRRALFCDAPPRIEVSLMDASVERVDLVDDELPKTARAALELSLAAEKQAHSFYAGVLPQVKDPAVRDFFAGLCEEEAEHVTLLEQKITRLAASTARDEFRAPAIVTASPPAPRAEYPDRTLVEAVLPQVDAATQAVARSVIFDGLEPSAVAMSLGVSRRTIARKLDVFLDIVKRYVAVAFAAGALVGCSGGGVPDSAATLAGSVEPQRSALSQQATAGVERPVARARAEAGAERAGEHANADERSAAAAAAAALDLEYSEGLKEPPQQQVVPSGPTWTPPAPAEVAADAEASAQPAIEDVWPDKTPEVGGERIVIRGQNLQPVQVLFGMVPATIVEVAPDKVVVTAPAARAGEVKIVVTNRDGSYALAAGAFRYYQ